MNTLVRAVRDTLSRCGLWRPEAKLLIALSGGCDSVALIHAVCRLRAEMPFCVVAVHVQHGLRGGDSLADEQFARALCRQLDVPLIVENAGLTGDMHTPGMETLARESRRRIFEKQLQKLSADALLLAHHQDDQTETVLMHLLRGSGMNGLLGMPDAASFGGALAVRPFLSIPKQRLRQALEAENLSCREDGSNQETLTPRNTLRLEALPLLEKLFPGAGAHVANMAQTLRADEERLSQEAEQLYRAICYARAPLFMLKVKPLEQAHESIRRRALRRWYLDGLAAAGLCPDERSLSLEDTLALSALVSGPDGAKRNLPCGLMAAKERDWMHLRRQNGEPLQEALPYEMALEKDRDAYALPHLRLAAASPYALPHDAGSVVVSPEWLRETPVFRTAGPQDLIHPFGAPGSKPLRRWLTDRKIDPFLRSALPVLCVRNEVLWIPGLCASERLRLDHLPHEGIQLTIDGETPLIPKSPKE